MAGFLEIAPDEFNFSPFDLIGQDWMLIAAEKEGKVNAMTASWGGLGVMWGTNVSFIVIRPQRFTKEFVDASATYSLNFFEAGNDNKKMLGYFGSVSGRDEDKIAKSNLTVEHAHNAPYFSQAKKVITCRKLYAQPYKPEFFIDSEPDRSWYPDKDYHTLYIGEVTGILVQG